MDDKFVKDVFYLGVHKINDYYDIYAALMPFINEILGLLTLTIFVPLFGIKLFPHDPTTNKQRLHRAVVNVLAVTGIVANAANYGAEYAREVGFVKGSLYAFFAFFIPNLLRNSETDSSTLLLLISTPKCIIFILSELT